MNFGGKYRGSLVGLFGILVIYGIITAVILVFALQFLSDISEGSPFQSFLLIPLGILLPLFLFVIVLLSIIRLVRELRARKPGALFKRRLIVFFALVVLLSSVPQAILSLSFIASTIDSWFSQDLENALSGGVEIALQYYRETVESLDNFSKGELLKSLLRDYHDSPEQLWDIIMQANPQVDAIQFFDENGQERAFLGEELAQRETTISAARRTGILPKEDFRDISLIRSFVTYEAGDQSASAVLSIILPTHFDSKARDLGRGLESFTQYRLLQNTFFSAVILFYFIFSFPLLLLSLLVSFMLSEEIMKPIVSLEAATRRVADGDYTYRVLIRPSDELAHLVESFNRMVVEIDRSRKKILQTEKIAAWQEIAQRLAHEIKNPLTPIKLSAQRIQRKFETYPEDLGEILPGALTTIITEVDNLTVLLQNFRDFSRHPVPTLRPVNLAGLIKEVLQTYADHHPQVRVDCKGVDSGLKILLDQGQMKRVFSNLLKNAFEAISGEGEISLRTNLVRKGNSSYSRISIEDTGRGIPEKEQNQVFNPYFTTKRGGTGLGLPIVERIIFDHRGQIWFESESNLGTTFYIDLPLGESL